MSFLASLRNEPELSFDYDATADRWVCSNALRELYQVPEGAEPTTSLMIERVLPEDRPVVLARLAEALAQPRPFSLEYRMIDPEGRTRRLVLVGQSEGVGGSVRRLSGSVIDITQTLRDGAAEAVLASSDHRASIEQAKGALMLSFGVEEDVAFEMLRTYSNQHNTRLVEVAELITAGLSDPQFARKEPVRALLDLLVRLERAGHEKALGSAS